MKKNADFFHMYFGAIKLALIILVIAGVLGLMGLDIAILAGAINSGAPAVAAVSLAAAAIVGAAAIVVLACSGYRLKEDRLLVVLGVFSDKVMYEDIAVLKRNGDTGELYVVAGNAQDGFSVRINVAKSRTDDFVAALRKHIPNIAEETFVIPPKKGKED